MKKILYILIALFLFACVSTPPENPVTTGSPENPVESPAREKTPATGDSSSPEARIPVLPGRQSAGYPDVEPAEIEIGTYEIPGNSNLNEDDYIKWFNDFVKYFNAGQAQKAIPYLSKIVEKYDDDGKSLYYLGASYLSNNQFEKGMEYLFYARDAGYDNAVELEDKISYALFQIAYDNLNRLDYARAVAWFKTSLQYKDEALARQNILFAYQELAKQKVGEEMASILIHADTFMQNHRIRHENIVAIANDLSKTVLDMTLEEYYEAAINSLNYVMADGAKPYLMQNLGMLYLLSDRLPEARGAFKFITENYKDHEVYEFSYNKFNEIVPVKYKYKAVHPVKMTITDKTGGKVTFTIQVPQNYKNQTAKNFKVKLNDREVEYESLTDNMGASFVKIEAGAKFLKNGRNNITVTADIEKESIKTDPGEIETILVSDYDSSDPLYKLLVESSSTANFDDSNVKKIVSELKSEIEGDTIIERIGAVYDYVVKKLDYVETPPGVGKIGVSRVFSNNFSGNCEDYSVLSTTLLRALDVPASSFTGETFNAPIGHAWTVIYTPDYNPIAVDATWGDTSGSPGLYFLYDSNRNVTTKFGYESDVLKENRGINVLSTGVHFELLSHEVTLELVE